MCGRNTGVNKNHCASITTDDSSGKYHKFTLLLRSSFCGHVIIIGGCDLLEGTFKVALKLWNLETFSVSSVEADVI